MSGSREMLERRERDKDRLTESVRKLIKASELPPGFVVLALRELLCERLLSDLVSEAHLRRRCAGVIRDMVEILTTHDGLEYVPTTEDSHD